MYCSREYQLTSRFNQQYEKSTSKFAIQYPSDLKKTTVVVESLSTNTTRCTVPENTSLLQDLINSMRNVHQNMKDYIEEYQATDNPFTHRSYPSRRNP